MNKTMTTLVTLGIIFILAFPAYRYMVDTYSVQHTVSNPSEVFHSYDSVDALYVKSVFKRTLREELDSRQISIKEYELGIAKLSDTSVVWESIMIDDVAIEYLEKGDSYRSIKWGVALRNCTAEAHTVPFAIYWILEDGSRQMYDTYAVNIRGYSIAHESKIVPVEIETAKEIAGISIKLR